MTGIVVTNLRAHDVLAHPLVLLEGYVRDASVLGVPPEQSYLDARLDAVRASFWPVTLASGKFKAFVLLPEPGKFMVSLRFGSAACEFPIEYAPIPNRYVVRFYYQKCVDAFNEGFDAPPGVDNSDQAAIDKIRFNALLMQTMTAEMFHNAGLPRRTFAMEFASDGLPVVKVLRSSFTNATARSIHDQKLIGLVHDDIHAYGLDAHPEFKFKHAVILGCSKFNPATQKAEGHTALGGEKVGVFGSCGLHTWPRHLGEITSCCLNNNKVDTRMLMDDSCYRGTFWANYSTGIGAFLHELGHTFGLGHSDTGIMGRGFDDMNRLLCVYEIDPQNGQSAFHYTFGDGRVQLNHSAIREATGHHGAHWNIGSARILKYCPWISAVEKQSTRVPTVSWVHDVCGPVGAGQYDGQQYAFGSHPSQPGHAHPRYELGAIVVDADSFLNSIQTFTRAEVAAWDGSKWHSRGHKHLFILTDGEYITQVDARAMAYIDGIQIHTNKRTSRWYGGFGGQCEVLKPSEGCQIHGFFGTVGGNYVGTLGALCSQVPFHESSSANAYPSPMLSAGIRSPDVAGLALSDGQQHPFSVESRSIQTVVVQCDEFVESIRVVSREEHTRNVLEQNRPTYGRHEHVFELLAGEKIVRVEIKSGHWVDAFRMVTSIRTSPWFGGLGGNDTQSIEAPHGHQICGFFGSRGNSYVGSLGILFCPDPAMSAAGPDSLSPAPYAASVCEHGQTERFSLLNLSQASLSYDAIVPLHVGAAIGIVVATTDNQVTFVQSFDSAHGFENIVARLYGSSQGNMEVHCFSLSPNERLVQIDVSYHGSDPSSALVEGICFHTTTRCSSWFGGYHIDRVRFFVAPKGTAVHDIVGSFTHSSLTDVVGHVMPAFAIMATSSNSSFSPEGLVRVDGGGFDIRVASRSSFGIESIHLLEKNNGDHLNSHAWDWNQHSTTPFPSQWFLPERMLTDKIGGVNAKELLFTEYVIGALDSGGGFSKSAGPPQ
uniref:Jacalin-type lectin domain-containing protein n=1 Tax=Globisporangium ultimum (strain ATCC 200006 / CBS 805.95 / DAOM BR144) TaxID=431595 RepID=K3WKE8_GLOUD